MVQFYGAMRAAEIPAAPATRHKGHPDSILGFASITLASAAGFGHYFVSMIRRMSLGMSVHDVAIIAGRSPRPLHG